ncbi:MAG: sulfite exporter TauE/SafE family protein [Verrucomicrobiota bacterium]|nr:sulfite exporter TauE/SafE family protein [Verrucomicrobiota bacterium]
MTPSYLILITLCILVVAFLYSSVGHAGASGYIAVMSLFSLAPAAIKPTALVLNILVACLGSYQFWRAGHFSWRLFWPFAVLSIPCAFLGGYWNLPTHIFKILVGIVLLFSALRFVLGSAVDAEPSDPSRPVSLGVGAGLGLLSGLTGTGGGIFLTPLLIFMHWARTKTASALSVVFILVNSLAGLLGNFTATKMFPSFAWPFAVAAVLGGGVGSYLGSNRFPVAMIKRLLAIVLTIAGLKLIFTK